MADQIQWLVGKANVEGSVEMICPKRHIGQTQWQSEWNAEYETYNDYISDYECIFNHPIDNEARLDFYPRLWFDLQKAKSYPSPINFANLVHLRWMVPVFRTREVW